MAATPLHVTEPTAPAPAPAPAVTDQAASAPFYLSVAGHTDVGKVREKNEDAFVVADLTGGTLLDGATHARFDVGERGVLLAVSDGMGGAAAGEVASAIVVETLTLALANAPADTPRDALMNDAVQKAHRAVWDEAKRESKKMGATLTAIFVRAGEAYIAEVGDSRAYLLRNGKLCQLTHDQSMVQMLVDTGVIEPEQAETSPIRNVILQAMGNQKNVKVALARLELRDRDCIVLCSDGLTGMVSDSEIKEVILASGRPELAAKQLVDLANERGGKDNITVVLAGVGGALTPPSPDETIKDTLEVLTSFTPPGGLGMPPKEKAEK
jgi:serine/threonine protein phosphatase PrpC